MRRLLLCTVFDLSVHRGESIILFKSGERRKEIENKCPIYECEGF